MRADQPEVHLCGVTRTWSEAAERRVGVGAAGGGGAGSPCQAQLPCAGRLPGRHRPRPGPMEWPSPRVLGVGGWCENGSRSGPDLIVKL